MLVIDLHGCFVLSLNKVSGDQINPVNVGDGSGGEGGEGRDVLKGVPLL